MKHCSNRITRFLSCLFFLAVAISLWWLFPRSMRSSAHFSFRLSFFHSMWFVGNATTDNKVDGSRVAAAVILFHPFNESHMHTHTHTQAKARAAKTLPASKGRRSSLLNRGGRVATKLRLQIIFFKFSNPLYRKNTVFFLNRNTMMTSWAEEIVETGNNERHLMQRNVRHSTSRIGDAHRRSSRTIRFFFTRLMDAAMALFILVLCYNTYCFFFWNVFYHRLFHWGNVQLCRIIG